jgi:hypothetical protein
MANHAILACVENTCRTVMDSAEPFGRKVVVLSGDFHQTCPVIQCQTRAQVADASIRSFLFWPAFKICHLTQPICNAVDPEFAHFVDDIGDGAGPEVPMPNMLDIVTGAEDLINFVYPQDILSNIVGCLKRAIFTPTNIQVDTYNETILKWVAGTERTYLAADKLKEVEDAGLTVPEGILDYVAKHPPPGFPHHTLTIKTGAVFRLLWNLSLDHSLVKNVQVVIMAVSARLITVQILRGMDGVTVIDSEDILIH